MATHSENPWRQLSRQAPFVLPEDAVLIAGFKSSVNEDLALHVELLPEPFLGRPDAPVVLLNLNPGYSPDDLEHHQDPMFAARSWDNLLHSEADYPFYLLDPKINAPGRKWWERKLNGLIQRLGRQAVARVLCIEYFPYHSKRFGHHRLSLPSQRYSFGLVRGRSERGALVVMMRSERLWFGAIPELASYPRLFRVRNVQNPILSPKNCPNGFEEMVRTLEAMASKLD